MSKDYIGSYTLQDFNDTTFFAEYSATGLEGSWHSSFQTGDLFMRTKTGENSWSQAIRIVGEGGVAGQNGSYVEYQFAKNTSSTIPPTTGWTDSPPTIASSEYLWMRVRSVDGEGVPTDWSTATRISGDKGDQGIQGPTGPAGQSQWTHLRYSINANGNPMVGSPTTETKYIGIAITTSSSAPTLYSSYTWQKFVGEDGAQGEQGIPGPTGEDGQPTYTWIKYADTPTTGMSDNPSGKPYIGIAHNKLTETESSTYGDYVWSLIKGDKGDTGADGRSITNVDVLYYLSTSSTSLIGGTWSTTAPSWENGKYIWSMTKTTYSDNSFTESDPACITGAQGITGRGIASIDAEFYLSSSKTTQTGGNWSTTMPNWSPGMYVWTRSLITYTSGTPAQETTTPLVSSEWEAINEIEIGGRNYFSASQLKALEPNNTTNTLETSETGLVYVKEVTAGEVYTLSRNSITVGAKFGYVFTIDDPGDGVACTTYVSDYEDDLVVAGITIPATYNYIVIYLTTEGETLPNVKLESGNQATDWTMSQEDLEKYLSDNETAAAEAKDYADQALSQLEQIQSAYTVFLEKDVGYVRCDVNGTPLDNTPLITNSIRIFKGVQELVPVALGEETIGSFSIEIPVNDLENNTYQINCEGSKIAESNNSFTVDSVVNDFDTGSLLINIYVEGKTGAIPTFEKIFYWSKNINTNILPTSEVVDHPKIGDLYEATVDDKKLIFRFNGEEWEDVTKFSNRQGEELVNKIGSFIIEENGEYVLNIINFFGDINAYAGEEITLTGEKILISGELLARSMKATDFSIVNDEGMTTFAVNTSGDVSMIGTINSMNYLLSQTGWKISENGDSEFNDTVVRGKLLLPSAGVVNDYDPNQTNGRNLVLNSDSLISNSNYLVATYLLSEDIVEGNTYTISLKGTRVAGQEFELFQNGGATSKGTILLEEDDVYSLTFVASAATSGYEREIRVYQSPELTAGLAEIEWIKMEKGDSITNWLPAPEDDSDPVRIYAGSTYEARNSAPFRVTQSGNLHAEQGVFSGLFTGRFALGDIEITDDNGEVDGLAEIRFIHDDDVTTTYPILISATSGSHFNIPFSIGAEDDPRFLVRSNEVLIKTHELRISQNENLGIASKDVVFPNSNTDKLIKFNNHSHNIDVIDNELLFNANSNPTNYHFKFQHNTGGSIKALIDGSLEINDYIGYEKLKIVKKTDVGNSGIDFTFE